MAGNYRRRNAPQRSGNMFGQLVLVCVVFVAGYLTASLYDLTSLTAWIGEHALAKNSAQLIIKPNVQQAQLPKPKFEFYTLLANEKVAGAGSATAAVPPPAPASQPQQIATAPAKALPLHAPLAPVATLATNNSAPPVVSAEKIPAIIANNTKEAYLVQVASFRSMQEAERMKASLVMRGFDVKIVASAQQQANWYRVVIGPFASRMQAQQAQQSFAKREHIMGMIRKMDA